MPLSNINTYHRPATLEAALALLREGRGRAAPLAGGSALVGEPPPGVESVVDLRDLQLDWVVAREDGSLSLGAMVTLATLVDDPTVSGYAGGCLCEAARFAAANLVRNRATLGGTVVARAARSDLATLLVALEARVVINDGEEHEYTIEDFFRRRPYLLQPGALLIELRLPAFDPATRVAHHRVARTPMDIPIVCVAAALRQGASGTVDHARLAAGGIADTPVPLARLAESLEGQESGQSIDDAVAQADAGIAVEGDALASEEYRRAMIRLLARRAIDELLHGTNGEHA